MAKEVHQLSYFIWRGRHASERKAATWAGAVDIWIERDDGSAFLAKEGQAQDPAALDAAGFSLNDFMDAITASAIRERDQAITARDAALSQRATAVEENNLAQLARNAAETDRAIAVAEKDAAEARALAAEAELRALQTGLQAAGVTLQPVVDARTPRT